MKGFTDAIKREILSRYKSVRKFAKVIDMPYTTLKSALDKENGIEGMAVEKALKIFKELGIDVNKIGTEIDFREERLLEEFRRLDDYDKETVILLTERMANGYNAFVDTTQVPIYDLAVSAGNGQFLDSEHFEIKEFPTNKVPRGATFAVRVSGESMEPDFMSGVIVFVKRTTELEVGDVGIFVKDSEGYIKELGEDRLISRNPEYPDIEVGKYDNLRVVGKVVGVYDEE